MEKVLESFSLTGITAAIFLDTRRTKDDLLFPCKFRVYHDKKRVYYPSGVDITEDDWQKLLKKKKAGKNLNKQKELLQIGFTALKNHIIDLVKEESGFSFPALDARLKRRTPGSLISEFLAKIEILEEEGRPSTASSYRCTINSIQKFTRLKLKLSDISASWLQKYEAYLLEQGMSKATVRIYMINIRSILNSNKEFISPGMYPFGKGKYQLKKGTGRRLALSLPQINEILKYDLLTEESRKYRDLWYFSFLCNGANINDLLRLRYSNIINNEIQFTRGKTITTNPNQEPIRATLLPAMQRIIEKHGNIYQEGSYIFPFLQEGMSPAQIRLRVQDVTKRINKRMKKIGAALGYGNITCYSCRHSYASILKHSNVSLAFISESLGHSDIRTTKAYLSSFDQDERAKVASLLNNE
jgi:integrase/recombinase XerD